MGFFNVRFVIKKTLFAMLGIASIAFVSCDFGFDSNSFQNKAGEYFREMTNTAAVATYEISPNDTLIDKDGNICVPATGEHTVTLLLRNPQRYDFTSGSNMNFGLAGNQAESPLPFFDDVIITQDSSDKSKIVIKLPLNFLKANPVGTNISPNLRLFHPVSRADFGLYDKLKLSSNSPPPMPGNMVVVQTDATPSKWVLCFTLPSASTINSYHSDIKSVSVNGASYDVTLSSGSIGYESGASIKTSLSGLAANQNTGLSFTAPSGTQATYYETGDNADENERIYTVTITDNAGLSSTLAASARGFKLSPAAAYQTSDTSYTYSFTQNILTKNIIGADENGNAYIRLHANPRTMAVTYTKADGTTGNVPEYTYDASNASIVYSLYSDGNFTNELGSGTISGLTGTVKVPVGTSYVRAFVRKPLYADSEIINWNCHAVTTNLYVSETGSDDEGSGDGSKAKPFRTIKKAIDTFSAGVTDGDYDSSTALTINVMTDLTPPQDFSGPYYANPNFGTSIQSLNIKGYGGRKTINASNSLSVFFNITSGTVNIENINLTGATNQGSSAAHALYISNATVTYKNGSIYGNTDSVYENGGVGIHFASSSLTLENATITGNRTNLGVTEKKGVGVSVSSGTITLKGVNKIYDNYSGAATPAQDNLRLPSSGTLTIDGSIAGSKVGVSKAGDAPVAGTPVVFTSGYSAHNTAAPGNVFVSDESYGIALNGSGTSAEAALAVSSGAIYTALDYNFSASLKDAAGTAAATLNLYPGATRNFVIAPSFTRTEPAVDPTQLYYNPQDQKLYLDQTFTNPVPVADGDDGRVTWTVGLYSGSVKVKDITPTVDDGKIKIAVAAPIYDDIYTLRVDAKYLGITRNAEFTFNCSQDISFTESEALEFIPTMTKGGNLKLTGIALNSTNVSVINTAIKSITSAGVLIDLDVSACTGPVDFPASAFEGCTQLKSIVLNSAVTSIGDNAFKGCSNFATFTLPEALEEIGTDAFNGCSSLTSITLPASLTKIASGAFANCSSLTSVTFEKTTYWNTTSNSAYSGGNAVDVTNPATNATRLRSLSDYWYRGVYTAGTAAEVIQNLTESATIVVVDPSPSNDSAYAMADAVQDNNNLGVELILDLSEFNRTGTTNDWFSGSLILKELILPNVLTSLAARLVKNCTKLTSITIPAGIASIPTQFCYGCTALETINYAGTRAQWNALTKVDGWNTNVPANVVHCSDGDVNL